MPFPFSSWLLILATFALPGHAQTTELPDIGDHYVVGCSIIGNGGKLLKSFPAKMCVFMDDGSFIAATNDPIRLARIGPSGKIIWTRDLHVHHQMKLSANGKRLITLGADVREGDLGRVRYDDFLVLSMDTGETIHHWSGYTHRKEYLKRRGSILARIRGAASRENLDYLYEYTHFNSISEIPENPTAGKIKAFRKGNFLVSYIGRFAILNHRLEKILWTMNVPLSDGVPIDELRLFHDVQALRNGNILVYNNWLGDPKTSYFELREINPVSAEIVWKYPPDDSIRISAESKGGVQYLPEGVLFNINWLLGGERTGAAFLIDRNGKTLWSLQFPEKLPSNGFVSTLGLDRIKTIGSRFQDIKKFDLSKFLAKNKI